jgi:hypothetical protein
LFLLRFSVVNSIHPYCRCVQPIPFFSVQHVLPRVVCVSLVQRILHCACCSLGPYIVRSIFPFKGSKGLPSSWTLSNFRMDSMRFL